MGEEHGLLPNSNVAWAEIREVISASTNNIHFTLLIKDKGMFLENLNKAFSKGRSLVITKYGQDGRMAIEIAEEESRRKLL